MDSTDSEILRLLREDGRMSWRDLGAAVGLTANAAADRVRRLRKAGVITGFTALVDPAAGGRHLEALVGVTLARGTDSDEFAVLASKLEPVTEVLHLSEKTIESHRANILRKLGMRDRVELVRYAIRRGLVEP